MLEYKIQEDTLTLIADAIRNKRKKSETILVSDMPKEINNIAEPGGILSITAPDGVIVEVSKKEQIFQEIAVNGVAVFYGLEDGEWTVIIKDGNIISEPRIVNVSATYTQKMNFFAAFINITFPSSLKISVTDGQTIIEAPSSASAEGVWRCAVPNTGDWTIQCNTVDWEIITITQDGQETEATVGYLFRPGWTKAQAEKKCTVGLSSSNSYTWGSDGLSNTNNGSTASFGTQFYCQSIDLRHFNKVCVRVSVYSAHSYYGSNYAGFGLHTEEPYSNITHNGVVNNKVLEFDLSTIEVTEATYCYVATSYGSGCIHEFWLE